MVSDTATEPNTRRDSIRWLIGGSVNLHSTLDELRQMDAVNDMAVEPLPVLTAEEVCEFVRRMLAGRNVEFTPEVPTQFIIRLGRPIPYFLQVAAQTVYRQWTMSRQTVTPAVVDMAFDSIISGQAARDKLKHYHARLRKHYQEPKRSAAYHLLRCLCHSDSTGISRGGLQTAFQQAFTHTNTKLSAIDSLQAFNGLLQSLENDFYVVESSPSRYDFASGILKQWWKKQYG